MATLWCITVFGADSERRSDVFVRAAGGDQVQHVQLPVGELELMGLMGSRSRLPRLPGRLRVAATDRHRFAEGGVPGQQRPVAHRAVEGVVAHRIANGGADAVPGAPALGRKATPQHRQVGRENAVQPGRRLPLTTHVGQLLGAHHSEGARMPVPRVAGQFQAHPEPASGVGDPPGREGLQSGGWIQASKDAHVAELFCWRDDVREQWCRAGVRRAGSDEREGDTALDRKAIVTELVGEGARLGRQRGRSFAVCGLLRHSGGAVEQLGEPPPFAEFGASGETFVGPCHGAFGWIVRADDGREARQHLQLERAITVRASKRQRVVELAERCRRVRRFAQPGVVDR